MKKTKTETTSEHALIFLKKELEKEGFLVDSLEIKNVFSECGRLAHWVTNTEKGYRKTSYLL